MIRLSLYQPDIAPNVGTLTRLSACLGLGLDIIEPCGFVWHDSKLRRAGMDYLDQASLIRHPDWNHYLDDCQKHQSRILLLTTRAATPYTTHSFRPNDRLLLGRESSGVPDEVHARADARLCIPMQAGMRSLNIAIAAAMVTGEALRQRNRTS